MSERAYVIECVRESVRKREKERIKEVERR